MALALIEKTPYAVLSYEIDWSDWLPSGDTISAVTWTVPTGITKDSSSATTTATEITLSSGTLGETYDVVCKITTAGLLKDSRTLRFVIIEK